MTSPPPVHGQPFQPPPQGQQAHGQQPQLGHPGQQYGRPAQLPAQSEGPPRNASPGRTTLWPVAVGILALVALGVSFWMGTYLAVYGRGGITFYLLILAVAAAVGALVAVWSETAFEVRDWGSDLFGKTALGWRRVDLANLTWAAIVAGRGNHSIILGDSQGRITFSDKKLGPVYDGVRRGVFEAGQQGRLLVPIGLAQLLGLPLQDGASESGKSGMTPKVLAVIGLILVGLSIGLVAAS